MAGRDALTTAQARVHAKPGGIVFSPSTRMLRSSGLHTRILSRHVRALFFPPYIMLIYLQNAEALSPPAANYFLYFYFPNGKRAPAVNAFTSRHELERTTAFHMRMAREYFRAAEKAQGTVHTRAHWNNRTQFRASTFRSMLRSIWAFGNLKEIIHARSGKPAPVSRASMTFLRALQVHEAVANHTRSISSPEHATAVRAARSEARGPEKIPAPAALILEPPEIYTSVALRELMRFAPSSSDTNRLHFFRQASVLERLTSRMHSHGNSSTSENIFSIRSFAEHPRIFVAGDHTSFPMPPPAMHFNAGTAMFTFATAASPEKTPVSTHMPASMAGRMAGRMKSLKRPAHREARTNSRPRPSRAHKLSYQETRGLPFSASRFSSPSFSRARSEEFVPRAFTMRARSAAPDAEGVYRARVGSRVPRPPASHPSPGSLPLIFPLRFLRASESVPGGSPERASSELRRETVVRDTISRITEAIIRRGRPEQTIAGQSDSGQPAARFAPQSSSERFMQSAWTLRLSPAYYRGSASIHQTRIHPILALLRVSNTADAMDPARGFMPGARKPTDLSVDGRSRSNTGYAAPRSSSGGAFAHHRGAREHTGHAAAARHVTSRSPVFFSDSPVRSIMNRRNESHRAYFPMQFLSLNHSMYESHAPGSSRAGHGSIVNSSSADMTSSRAARRGTADFSPTELSARPTPAGITPPMVIPRRDVSAALSPAVPSRSSGSGSAPRVFGASIYDASAPLEYKGPSAVREDSRAKTDGELLKEIRSEAVKIVEREVPPNDDRLARFFRDMPPGQVNVIAQKVYSLLERKLSVEAERRGL